MQCLATLTPAQPGHCLTAQHSCRVAELGTVAGHRASKDNVWHVLHAQHMLPKVRLHHDAHSASPLEGAAHQRPQATAFCMLPYKVRMQTDGDSAEGGCKCVALNARITAVQTGVSMLINGDVLAEAGAAHGRRRRRWTTWRAARAPAAHTGRRSRSWCGTRRRRCSTRPPCPARSRGRRSGRTSARMSPGAHTPATLQTAHARLHRAQVATPLRSAWAALALRRRIAG